MPGRNVERRCSDVLQGCAEPSSAFVPDDRPQRLDCADEQGFEATLPSATRLVPSNWITQRSAPAHGRRMRDHGSSPAKCLSPSGRGSAIAVISWSGRSTQSISARAISGWRGVPRALSVPALAHAARGRPSSSPAGTAAAQHERHRGSGKRRRPSRQPGTVRDQRRARQFSPDCQSGARCDGVTSDVCSAIRQFLAQPGELDASSLGGVRGTRYSVGKRRVLRS